MTDTTPALTERQMQVIGLLVTGASIKQIASRLEISTRTVKKHLTAARINLGAETRDHLVALAVSKGLVEMQNAEVFVTIPTKRHPAPAAAYACPCEDTTVRSVRCPTCGMWPAPVKQLGGFHANKKI